MSQRGLQPGRQTPGQRRLTDGTVKVWDAQTGQELLTLKGHTARSTAWPSARTANAWPVRWLRTETVKVWDAQTGQELLTFKGHTGTVTQRGVQPRRQTAGLAPPGTGR